MRGRSLGRIDFSSFDFWHYVRHWTPWELSTEASGQKEGRNLVPLLVRGIFGIALLRPWTALLGYSRSRDSDGPSRDGTKTAHVLVLV